MTALTRCGRVAKISAIGVYAMSTWYHLKLLYTKNKNINTGAMSMSSKLRASAFILVWF